MDQQYISNAESIGKSIICISEVQSTGVVRSDSEVCDLN